MTRSDKKNRTCVCCGKTLYSPHKLRQHYKSNKNQCTFQAQQPVTADISSEQLTPLEPLQEPAVNQLQAVVNILQFTKTTAVHNIKITRVPLSYVKYNPLVSSNKNIRVSL